MVFMAALAICYKTPYKDQNLPTLSVIRQNDKRLMYESVNMPRSFSSFPGQICQSCYPSYKVNNILTKSITKEGNPPKCIVYGGGSSCITELIHRHSGPDSRLSFIQGSYSKWKDLSRLRYSAESSFMEKQLRLLDSYFGKLQDNANSFTFDSSNKVTGVHQPDHQSRSKKGLESLVDCLGKVNNGVSQESRAPSTYVEHYSEDKLAPKPVSIRKDTERANFRNQKIYVDLRRIRGVRNPRSAIDSQQQDQTSSLYLIGTLASVNIAVFLFEIASPIRNDDFELFSLPLLYGAKINHLIVLGEWWRLVTPMFLHAGIFHIALSCWALLLFGPQVCRGYGSFNFFLIYILGGLSGNLTSFLHTADPTVGGTGPVFAIIGAWLMYQIQNRDVIASEASENMFQKAIIVAALGFILSNLGPIDQWTHSGAAFTGMAYGFLTSPIVQLDDATSSGTGQEGLKLVRQNGDSCKSLILFTIFIFVLSLFLFFMEPPLNAVTAEDLEYM